MTKNYYKILGIEENATESDIRRAYIKLARETHPDKGGNEEEFKKVNKAYEILIDESKRKEYDNGNENVSVEKYGYDYEEEVEELSLGEHLKDLNYLYLKLRDCGSSLVSDYHLVRGKRFLQVLYSYYEPIYKKIGWNKFFMDYVMSSVHTGNGLVWMSIYRGWEGNINHFKDLLNKARTKLGLLPLTDQDLKIEGNNQNETPQISDNGQNPKPIKNGFANIEEYNKSWSKENNETVRKFWELRDTIYNTAESLAKYSAVNSTLYKEMNNKAIEAETGNFREIQTNDDENKIGEVKKFNEGKLEKMKEAIKLMEKIIEESNNYQPTTTNTQSGDKKRKADELESYQSFTKKNKTVGDELSRLIREAQGLSKYEELAAKIKEIDEYQGERAYNEEYQKEIKQLKINLGNINKDKYRSEIIKKIDGKLSEGDVKESDLDEETKQELTKIRNGEIEDVNKINDIENKITEKVGEKGATNTLSKWLQQAKDLVNGVKTGTIDYLETELKKIRKGLYDFQYSTNVYYNKAYQNKENDVQAMLTKLENYSVSNNVTQPSRGFLQPKLLIPVALLAVLSVVVIVLARKRRQMKVK